MYASCINYSRINYHNKKNTIVQTQQKFNSLLGWALQVARGQHGQELQADGGSAILSS